ncbi:MAG: leucyl/phenylalanyl-tRNA--protein transferase [Bacteroidales bacterium]|nr:leucyl/phenylalanyl-tRNA--protein transferase [Bacteroidales bacterium]
MYILPDNKYFELPDPGMADQDGLVAIGGNLLPENLLHAYSKGIFPWYSENSPILWWSPDPRLVLLPANLKVNKSMRQILRNNNYNIKFDSQFHNVVVACSKIPRKGQQGTWITTEMIEAYTELFNAGHAHSVEVEIDGELAGGLYGVVVGKAFFGESMFYKKSNASKIALYFLIEKLKKKKFHLIDAQVETDHLISLGAMLIPRYLFLSQLKKAVEESNIAGKW